MNKQYLEPFLESLVKEANKLREDAGYGGHHHDGGAAALLAQVETFRAGLSNQIPVIWETRWNEFVREYKKKIDPEYNEYQRLKLKFEGM